MSRRTAAWLAWSVWALSLPFAAFSGVLGFLTFSSQPGFNYSFSVLISLFAFTFPIVGALIASRRPKNPIGWIFCAGGLLFGVIVAANNYSEYAQYTNSGLPDSVRYATWFSTWASFPALFLAATMLCLLFPDGRLPPPLTLWRLVAWTAVIGSAIAAFGDALALEDLGSDYGYATNPVAVGGALGTFLQKLGGFGSWTLFVSCLASVFSLFPRWDRASGQERQQLKWFAYAAAIMTGGFILAFSFGGWARAWDIGMFVGALGFGLLPVATAIAILKYRLYEIDRIINRSLVYGSLTAMLALLYFGGVTATQALLRTLTEREQLPQLVVVASTLLIAALFNPLRRRLQSFIDRRFYRRKYDARKTLEAFSSKL
jgi:hypothetical protein